MQHERICISAQFGNDEGHALGATLLQERSRTRNQKAAGICALRPTGLKMHSYENARPASPGTSKTELNICHWEVANVVPGEEHAGCCETMTASRVKNSRSVIRILMATHDTD